MIMELKPLKKGEVAVNVAYHITEDLVNEKIPFLRSYSRMKASDGIPAIYIDDQGRKKPTSTITFTEPGEHIVRIVLEDNTIIPWEFLHGAEHIYSVDIPETVTKIEKYAFRWTHIVCPPVLPPNLKTIEGNAFDGAYVDVENVQLPDSVETVDMDAFQGVKHLIVGKNYRGDANNLNRYEKVTIPADNNYLEVRDGFIINRETREVQGLLPGAFENAPEVVIRLPEGTTGFNRKLFSHLGKVSVSVPGSVKKCKMYLSNPRDPEIRTIELGEGIEEIEISADHDAELKLGLPHSATKVGLRHLKTDYLSIPNRCILADLYGCSIARLDLGAEVSLDGAVFGNVKSEVFVEGPLHFEIWGCMKDESVIHVPDKETGKKILDSLDFNKKVKIFVGADQALDDQEDGAQEKRLFNLLGCPDYPKTLKPIESNGSSMPKMVTLLYDLPKKTAVEIQAKCWEYTLDDGDAKKFKGKITIPKGQHIVRLIDIRRLDHDPLYDWDSCDAPVFEQPCDAMLIDDNYELKQISSRIKGVKHLILGARCHITEFKTLSFERISVVPENPWLEYRDGCIIDRETQKLIFVNADATQIPNGILEIAEGALKNYRQERLVIPCYSKEVSLHRAPNKMEDHLDNLKELVFEDGIEDISLFSYKSFNQDIKIVFPKTLKRLTIESVKTRRITVPYACELRYFDCSTIDCLEFLGDVTLRPDYDGDTFDDFSGNIRFCGSVSLCQRSVSGQDKPGDFIGELNDDCTITVANQETADAIKHCKDYNPKVKIIVKE